MNVRYFLLFNGRRMDMMQSELHVGDVSSLEKREILTMSPMTKRRLSFDCFLENKKLNPEQKIAIVSKANHAESCHVNIEAKEFVCNKSQTVFRSAAFGLVKHSSNIPASIIPVLHFLFCFDVCRTALKMPAYCD